MGMVRAEVWDVQEARRAKPLFHPLSEGMPKRTVDCIDFP
jgi:hypothetical protein